MRSGILSTSAVREQLAEIGLPLADNQGERLRDEFADELLPPERLTLSEWSDRYREIPAEGAAEPGRWRTSRFPFLKRIMDLLSPSDSTQRITVIKGSQLGFTECAINFILYTIDHSPAPMLYVQPTLDTVKRFGKQRLEPSIRLCDQANSKLAPVKSRDSSNTASIKSFPAGVLIMGGANSAAGLRSMPIQNLLIDERDSYPEDLEGEGDPAELAIRRTSNFPRRKIFDFSTPKIRETSRIEPAFEAGSMERYHVPCPECKHKQVLYWPSFEWDGDDHNSIRYICVKCKARIYEHSKTWMLEHGKWIAEDPDNEHKSLQISGLYSPLGFFSWAEAAEMFIRWSRTFDKTILKVFVNTVLGETWRETGRSIESAWVRKRKEPYASEVPSGALMLTAGADIQEDRIEVEVVGWGAFEESWSIDYAVFMGDTEVSQVWGDLDAYLKRTWRHASGADVPIVCSAIDSGHRAKVVYKFCRPREFRRIYPVKGFDGFGKGHIRKPKHRNDDGVWLFNVFVDEVKSKIYSQLQIGDPGPGYCHFPLYEEPKERNPMRDGPRFAKYDEDYFRGLVSETLESRRRNGRKVLRWMLPKGRRNEPLDCRAYAYAAFCIANVDINRIAEAGLPIVPKPRRMVRRRGRVLSKGI